MTACIGRVMTFETVLILQMRVNFYQCFNEYNVSYPVKFLFQIEQLLHVSQRFYCSRFCFVCLTKGQFQVSFFFLSTLPPVCSRFYDSSKCLQQTVDLDVDICFSLLYLTLACYLRSSKPRKCSTGKRSERYQSCIQERNSQGCTCYCRSIRICVSHSY